MKNKRLLVPLICTPLLAVSAAFAQEMFRPRQVYTVQRDGQELFREPWAYAGIKARLKKGQELSIVGTKNLWKEVAEQGVDGWVLTRVKRRYGGVSVSKEFLSDATTAPIGAGLVTKGFGEAYGREHGQNVERAAEVRAEMLEQRASFADYEAFLGGGDEVREFSGEAEVPSGGVQREDSGAAQAGAQGTAKVPAEQRQPRPEGSAQRPEFGGVGGRRPEFGRPEFGRGERSRDERENLLDSLRRGRDGQREGLRMASDRLFFTRNLSFEAEREMGIAVGQRLAAGGIHEDEALARYVNLIGAAVVEQCDRADIPYRFIVLDSPELNAFAAPGGFIFITVGCIRACKNEAELAGVIAHEVAHVARRHSLRTMDKHKLQIQKQMQAAEMDRVLEELYGPMDPQKAALVKQLRSLADESYKYCTGGWGQEFELEADAYGLRYAASVGWHPGGLVGFLKTLAANESDSLGEAFRTHPPSAERIESLRRIMREESILERGAINKARFLETTAGVR